MRRSMQAGLIAGILLTGGAAYAQFGNPETIGKEAANLFEVRNPDNREVLFSIKRYRGRVTAFYFWRLSNHESIRLMSTINTLDKKLRSKGVRFVSIAPDEKADVEKAAAERGVELLSGDAWNFYGPGAWYVQALFGAMSHPEVVIVDPESRIVWRGSATDRLEERLLEVCEATQPLAGDAKRMTQRMRQAKKFLDQGEVAKAYTLARQLYRVTDDESPVHGEARTLMDGLEQAAAEWLKKAIEAERAGDAQKAAHIVAQISVRMDDEDQRSEKRDGPSGSDTRSAGGPTAKPEGEKLQVVKDAEQEIGRMNGDRKLKQAIRAAMDQCRAELLLEKAADLEETDQFDAALVCYREVIKKFKESSAAKDAEASIKRIREDKKMRAAVDKARNEAEARRWMDIAERFAKLDLPDQAREYYERVISEHPKSPHAQEAKKRIEQLPKPTQETVDARSETDVAGRNTP